jgi:hypothetical protein
MGPSSLGDKGDGVANGVVAMIEHENFVTGMQREGSKNGIRAIGSVWDERQALRIRPNKSGQSEASLLV